MSVLSEKVRFAMFDAMNVSEVTDIATGGVHHIMAPVGTKLPYVVFNRQAPGTVLYAFANTRIAEADVWLIKCLADEDSSDTMEPQELNETVLAIIEEKLGNELTLEGDAVTWNVERTSDLPEYVEVANDRLIFHTGFFVRVWAA